jgi:hypothetical protein
MNAGTIYIYIYIYICVCVCVSVTPVTFNWFLSLILVILEYYLVLFSEEYTTHGPLNTNF